MADGQWERIEELFERVHGMPAQERLPFLDRACVGDQALRTELEAMLAVERNGSALSVERLVVDESAGGAEDDPWLGQRLGPWRLTRIVGHGGMGLVYGASRDDGQYQQEVAVKLMRTGLRDAQAVERFRIERQVLASLKHPNIAGLVDGGFAPDGAPYLVMELVDGIPITDWCHERRLSLEGRLALFRTVCDAVQHAHRALVVHRDLKPGNVFVSSTGDVKLLDFGIAKLLDPSAWGIGGEETRVEMRLLSPDYAAPEQRDGGPITTGTDVYALGIVLYELIAGVRPQRPARGGDEDDGHGGAPTTLTPPSEALRQSRRDPAAGADGASARAAERRKLARRVRGDLDRIVLTALREDPGRRYASAGQLGEEVGRFLSGLPVLAQPDTLGYRVRRFVGRNAIAVALATTIVVGLAIFGGLSAWQASVLAEQRRVAQRERDTAEQVVRVLIDLFEATNPSVRPDGDRMALGDFLTGQQARALERLRDTPAVQAKLQQVFGFIHHTRGQYGLARQALQEALETQRRLVGPDHPETLDTLQALGEVAHLAGDTERARTLLEESLERHRRVYGEDHPKTARVLQAVAPVVIAQDPDRAGDLLQRALDIRRATLGPRHPDVGESLGTLAGYYSGVRGDFQRAKQLYEQALAVFPRPLERRNPLAITILNDYAVLLGRLDMYGEAEARQQEAIAIARQVLGPDSLTVANLLNNLGTTQAMLRKHALAGRTYAESFETHRALLGEGHWRTRNAARNVGRLLALQQRYAEALPWFDRACEGLPPDSSEFSGWGIRAQRAHVLFRLGRRGEALAEIRQAVASLEPIAGRGASDASQLAVARVFLGRMLIESGRPREAEPPLRAALAWFETLGPQHPRRAEIACELARARLLQKRSADELQTLQRYLPLYKDWALAEPEVVAALERLLVAGSS